MTKIVECIDCGTFPLTLHKKYEMLGEDTEFYRIYNDNHNSRLYFKSRFKILSDSDTYEIDLI